MSSECRARRDYDAAPLDRVAGPVVRAPERSRQPDARRSPWGHRTLARSTVDIHERSFVLLSAMGKGDATRAAILRHAVSLASTHGLEGLSIGPLAARSGLSKS